MSSPSPIWIALFETRSYHPHVTAQPCTSTQTVHRDLFLQSSSLLEDFLFFPDNTYITVVTIESDAGALIYKTLFLSDYHVIILNPIHVFSHLCLPHMLQAKSLMMIWNINASVFPPHTVAKCYGLHSDTFFSISITYFSHFLDTSYCSTVIWINGSIIQFSNALAVWIDGFTGASRIALICKVSVSANYFKHEMQVERLFI